MRYIWDSSNNDKIERLTCMGVVYTETFFLYVNIFSNSHQHRILIIYFKFLITPWNGHGSYISLNTVPFSKKNIIEKETTNQNEKLVLILHFDIS